MLVNHLEEYIAALLHPDKPWPVRSTTDNEEND